MLASAYDLDVSARMSCAFLLAVAVFIPASAGHSWREGPGIRADIDGDRVPDRLTLKRPLNRSLGLEIQVLLWYGASHEALVFFTMHRGRLVRMTGAQPRSSDPYVWEMGGTPVSPRRIAA
jgi:hypothetical protein